MLCKAYFIGRFLDDNDAGQVREPYGWRLVQEFDSPQDNHLLLPLTRPADGDVHEEYQREEDEEYLVQITPEAAGGVARLLQYHPDTDTYLRTG